MYPRLIRGLRYKATHIVVSMDSEVRNEVIVSVRMVEEVIGSPINPHLYVLYSILYGSFFHNSLIYIGVVKVLM